MYPQSLSRIAAAFTLLFALTACGGNAASGGGSSNDGGSPAGGGIPGGGASSATQGCTFRLEGAIQETSPCGAVATKLLNGTTRVDIAARDSSSTVIDFVVQGDLKPGTYALADGTASAVTVATTDAAGNEWIAASGWGGSLTVQVTGVSPVANPALSGYFDLHGTATAVLPGALGASGTVQLSVTF